MTQANYPFSTPLIISGPYRSPRQMLQAQNYDGHESIHDESMAGKFGFRGAPIEAPTHFSQFEPLLAGLWGKNFYEHGCISAHFRNMVIEGEEVKASLHLPAVPLSEIRSVRISAEKKDGSPVLEGTASLGPDHPESELERRISQLKKPGKLVILRDMKVGDRGAATEHVIMDFDQHMGSRYPFTLAQKLEKITEIGSWHTKEGATSSPWGRAVIPFEMISVLAEYTVAAAEWKMRSPHLDLFVDLEIRLIEGPLFAGEKYVLDRQIIALSESPRTESFWYKTSIHEEKSGRLVAYTLLNYAAVKDSFPGYKEERGLQETAS